MDFDMPTGEKLLNNNNNNNTLFKIGEKVVMQLV